MSWTDDLARRLETFTWRTEILGNTVVAWLIAVVVFMLVITILRASSGIVQRRTADIAVDSRRHWLRSIHQAMDFTHTWVMAVVAIYVASLTLNTSDQAQQVVKSMAVLALCVQCALWTDVLFSIGIEARARQRLETDASSATTLGALGVLGRFVIRTIAVLVALDNLGINITTLVAGLGIGGVAVALAAQSVLRDLLASLSIVLDKPFVLGDFVIVGDLMGVVEFIGLRTTRIRSLSGEQLIVPNNDLIQSRIRNFKRMQERRALFTFGLAFDTPVAKLEQVPKLVRSIVEELDGTRFDRSHLKDLGPGALVFETVYYVQSADYNRYMDIQQAINLKICAGLREQQLLPVRTI